MKKCKVKEIEKFVRQMYIDLLYSHEKQANVCFIGEIWNGNINNYPFKISEIFDESYLKKITFRADRNYYFTTSTFKQSPNGIAYRRMNNVDTCQDIIIDVDCHNGYPYEQIKDYINLLIIKINETRMNFMPSYAVATGRGVQFIWKLRTVSGSEENLNKLYNVTNALIDELNGFIDEIVKEHGFKAEEYIQVDNHASCNFAGYFRIAGTVNAKCDALVRYCACGGIYNLDEMCEYYNISLNSAKKPYQKQEMLTEANIINGSEMKKSQKSDVEISSQNLRKTSKNNEIQKRHINRVVNMAIDGKVDAEKLFEEIANTSTKVNISKNKKLSVKENQLMKKRIKMICYLLDEYKAQGITEGYRDILLFLLYNNQYFLDPESALNEIWNQNSKLLKPLSNREIKNIIDYINAKNGLKFKDETFISWLNLTDEQIQMYYHHKITRMQGHINTLEKQERNKRIKEDYAQIMERTPKPTVLSAKQELHEKYGLSIRQIQNIISPKLKEVVKKALNKVKDVLTPNTNTDTTQPEKLGNVFAVYGGDGQPTVAYENWESILRSYKEDGFEAYFDEQDKYCSLECPDDDMPWYSVGKDFTSPMTVSSQLDRLTDDLKDKYPKMCRFLNRKDWYVLKSMYLYAKYKFNDKYSFGYQAMFLSYSAIRYLGLPISQGSSRFADYLLDAKKFVLDNINMKSIFNQRVKRHKSYGYVIDEDMYARYETKLLKASLRKLMYLGLIRGCAPKQGYGYSISGYVLTQFDFDFAESKAFYWFANELHTSCILSDAYVYAKLYAEDLNRICYVRGEAINTYDIDDVGLRVGELLTKRDWIKFSELKKWQQDVFDKYSSCAWFGEMYRVVKVRSKYVDDAFNNLIRSIIGDDVRAGTRVIIPVKFFNGLDEACCTG